VEGFGFVAAAVDRFVDGVTSITNPEASRRAKRPRSSPFVFFEVSAFFVVMSFPRCGASCGDHPDDRTALRDCHVKQAAAARLPDDIHPLLPGDRAYPVGNGDG
jgi:hypothetical protein